jgi:glycosyltransferase involved in cell wall biosynthesis
MLEQKPEPMRVAMIGIKAIPARFGGFETAVDELSRGLVKLGYRVRVYNRSYMATASGNSYGGVQLVNLPTLKSKNLSTIVHAFLCTLHVLFHPVDVVHYFTTGVTLFAPFPRLFGMKVVCSVDGTDWQRAKWSRLSRWYLRFSEKLAVLGCHRLISDSRDVMNYYQQSYGAESSCIAYGMREHRSERRDILNRFGLQERRYILFVGRLVPENNIHHLIRAFERTSTDQKLIIVGDDPWEKEYVRSLKSSSDPRVIFAGGVYGDEYAQLQQNAYLFVLPDEVGGTHPALVEAMGYGNCVLVNDTPSNLEVIADSGFHYCGASGDTDLQRKLEELLDAPETVARFRARGRERAQSHYRWEDVVRQHSKMYKKLMGDTDQVGKAEFAQPEES